MKKVRHYKGVPYYFLSDTTKVQAKEQIETDSKEVMKDGVKQDLESDLDDLYSDEKEPRLGF